MAFVLDKVSEDTFYENILLGVTKILEKHINIRNVNLERQPACAAIDVILWEQLNGVKLPDDLKEFYLATNGIKLSWSYIFSDHEVLPVGLLKIRPLVELNDLTKCHLQVINDLKPLKNNLYQYCNSESRVFYLANVDDNSKVCLVYGNPRTTPQIYLVENDTYGYYLTNNFRKYLCMAITHLALPLWQYCFTPQGVPSWVEQMFIMVAPHLGSSEPITEEPDEDYEERIDFQEGYFNHIDANIFKLKRHSSRTSDIGIDEN